MNKKYFTSNRVKFLRQTQFASVCRAMRPVRTVHAPERWGDFYAPENNSSNAFVQFEPTANSDAARALNVQCGPCAQCTDKTATGTSARPHHATVGTAFQVGKTVLCGTNKAQSAHDSQRAAVDSKVKPTRKRKRVNKGIGGGRPSKLSEYTLSFMKRFYDEHKGATYEDVKRFCEDKNFPESVSKVRRYYVNRQYRDSPEFLAKEHLYVRRKNTKRCMGARMAKEQQKLTSNAATPVKPETKKTFTDDVDTFFAQATEDLFHEDGNTTPVPAPPLSTPSMDLSMMPNCDNMFEEEINEHSLPLWDDSDMLLNF